jgi:hypothetical protein
VLQGTAAEPVHTYSRPHYRFGAVDESRCITLPTVEVDALETRKTDGAVVANSTDGLMRREAIDEARQVVPSHPPSYTSKLEEKRRDEGDQVQPTITTSTLCSSSQKSTKSGGRQKFKPHASVGQARGPRECDRLMTTAKAILRGQSGHTSTDGGDGQTGIDCRIDKVYLLTKPTGKGGPYELFSVADLREVDEKAT